MAVGAQDLPDEDAAPPRARPLDGRRALLLVAAVAAAVVGPAYAVNGATQAPAPPAVPVVLPDAPGPAVEAALDAVVSSGPTGPVVRVWGAGALERLAERADAAALGVGAALVAVVLSALLRTTVAGRPWRRPQARALVLAAAGVLLAGVVGPAVTAAAQRASLDRLGLGDAGPQLVVGGPEPWAWAVAGGLLVLAAAARRAGQPGRTDR
ncbi:hypothetical protein WDV85_08875 [Pseudokineococcus sp. 5B2Z-1]|uniref:hypothetical protein n=1 Tax=Pseudokineococcus sp. 5B2Z-1 TaxID=3132744 RepID=UPI0030B4861E